MDDRNYRNDVHLRNRGRHLLCKRKEKSIRISGRTGAWRSGSSLIDRTVPVLYNGSRKEREEKDMTRIDIISGFLGAGKTTLIQKLLKEALQDEQVVLVENEFGKVGIDSGFLKDSGVQIKELYSGCICCSLVGDFYYSLKEIMETYHPQRILIEPSGVGKLSDVMTSVINMSKKVPEVKLNALITVANVEKVSRQMKAFGEFFNNQIEHASTIILSRTQNISTEELEQCVKEIRALNPKAALITTPWDQIDGMQILRVAQQQDSLAEQLMAECEAGHHDHEHHDHDHHDHDHHADEIFISWGKETPHRFEKTYLEQLLKQFSETEDYGIVLRAKGMVEGTDGHWIYFDMVPGEYSLRDGAPDYTGRICVIGTDLLEEKLEEAFS